MVGCEKHAKLNKHALHIQEQEWCEVSCRIVIISMSVQSVRWGRESMADVRLLKVCL